MEEKQLELLKALAEKLKSNPKERAGILASLQSAKILTKQGNFTGHLRNLDQMFATAE